MRAPDVLVGVDGSAPAIDALRWAAHEAGRRKSPLRVLSAYRPPWPGEDLAVGVDLEDIARTQAQCQVDEMVTRAREDVPGLIVSGRVMHGPAAPVLLDASSSVALLVVGFRGHGGFASLVLGATSLQVSTHANAPVVVVRGRSGPGNVGRVVVGSDGSTGSDTAIQAAFQEAAWHESGLTVVRAFGPPMSSPFAALGASSPDEMPEREAAEHAALDASIAAWRQKFPLVDVKTQVTIGDAAQALLAASGSARMIVVGTRGRGGFAGLLLGSVGQKLLHHAGCPVLIARRTASG